MIYDISTLFIKEREYAYRKCMYQRWQGQSFSYRTRPRPDHGLLYVASGKIRFVFSGGELTAAAEDIVFLPKNCNYEALILPEFGETKDYLLNFDFVDDEIPDRPVKLLHTQGQWFPELCRGIIRKQLAGEGHSLWVKGQMYLLLDQVCDRLLNSEPSPREQLLQNAKQLLVDCPEFSVAQVAKQCGISESGLRSRFQKACGCSPQQYRMDAKLRKAKLLLESTDLTVAAIAQELQFYDEAYFCKIFRKYTGCSPKGYLDKKTL